MEELSILPASFLPPLQWMRSVFHIMYSRLSIVKPLLKAFKSPEPHTLYPWYALCKVLVLSCTLVVPKDKYGRKVVKLSCTHSTSLYSSSSALNFNTDILSPKKVYLYLLVFLLLLYYNSTHMYESHLQVKTFLGKVLSMHSQYIPKNFNIYLHTCLYAAAWAWLVFLCVSSSGWFSPIFLTQNSKQAKAWRRIGGKQSLTTHASLPFSAFQWARFKSYRLPSVFLYVISISYKRESNEWMYEFHKI